MERSIDEHPSGAAALSLRTLRALWPEPVCPDCADWQVVEIITFDHALRPETCPTCGRHVPIATAVELVGVSYEAI
jgi:hypothetical protein